MFPVLTNTSAVVEQSHETQMSANNHRDIQELFLRGMRPSHNMVQSQMTEKSALILQRLRNSVPHTDTPLKTHK